MKKLNLFLLVTICAILIPIISVAGTVEVTFEAVGTGLHDDLWLVPMDYDGNHTIVTGTIIYDPSIPTDGNPDPNIGIYGGNIEHQFMTINITLSAPALDGVSPPYQWGSYNEDRLVAYGLSNHIKVNGFLYEGQWAGELEINETVYLLSNANFDDYNRFYLQTDTLISLIIPPIVADGLPLEFSAIEYDPESDGFIEFGRFDDSSADLYKVTKLNFNITHIQAQSIAIDPIANAGTDQIVFDRATLDGSLSKDLDGMIESYHWDLQHRENSSYNQTAEGVSPVVSNLESGFYDATLTVTDDDGLTGTDTVLIVAAGTCIADNDNDGYSVEMGDCNDNDSTIHPAAIEICDGIDNNCNDQADEGFDVDGDNYTTCGGDCNDNNPLINPVAEELPGNEIDENCDGSLGNCDPNANWKNHGQYVRCVAHEVEELVNAGVITHEEGDVLISSAAQSDIGKK